MKIAKETFELKSYDNQSLVKNCLQKQMLMKFFRPWKIGDEKILKF